MNYDSLKTKLQNKEVSNIYLLYGEEEFLIEAVVKRLEKLILGENKNPMSLSKFSGTQDEMDIIESVTTIPFLSCRKLVVCKNTDFFKGSKKKKNLLDLFAGIPEFSYLIFTEKNVDKSNPQFDFLNKAGYAYRVELRTGNDLMKYIADRFKKNNKIISADNARLFIEYSGFKLMDIESDIEKILLFMGDKAQVKSEYIRDLCSKNREAKVYELFDAICLRNKSMSMKVLKELMAMKIPIQIIFTSLYSAFMELVIIKAANEKGSKPELSRSGVKVPDFILKKNSEKARKYSVLQLNGAIKLISEYDYKVKSGEINDESALELLMVSLVLI